VGIGEARELTQRGVPVMQPQGPGRGQVIRGLIPEDV